MSVAISSSSVLAFVQQHMDKYGEMLKDKMEDAERTAQMMEDISKAQRVLTDWRAHGSTDKIGETDLTVQQAAIAELEELKEKYPELAAELDDFIEYAKGYDEGDAPGECNGSIDAMNKRLGDIKDANGKHDQLTMLEINDLHSKYNRVAELANQFLSANARTIDAIVKNVGG